MGAERRLFGRIEASLECSLATAEDTFEAKVLNLSRSGAGLMAKAPSIKRGDQVSVLVERADGEFTLSLSGVVVRAKQQGEDWYIGLRFEALPPDAERELVRLLKALAQGRGAGRREFPRVQARVAVRCKTPESFIATLNDLSRGGLSVSCPRPVELGSELTVQFGFESHDDLISVSGPVLHVDLKEDGRFLVGMRFVPPPNERKERVEHLINVLLGLGPRQAMVLEDDDES